MLYSVVAVTAGWRQSLLSGVALARTNLLAGVMAVLLSLTIWVGEAPIMMLMTAQDTLIDAMRPHWVWVALLPLASFLAFQMDGIFVGATCGRQMRNAMLVAAGLFAVVLTFQTFDVGGLIASFAAYLAVRGLSLSLLFGQVRATTLFSMAGSCRPIASPTSASAAWAKPSIENAIMPKRDNII